MKFNNFHKLLILVFSILLLAIIIFVALLNHDGPRVRFVTTDPDVESSAYSSGAIMNIVFDRPLQDNNYDDQIKFSPSIEFSSITNGQTISIRFEKNLQQETEYSVSIGAEIYDTKGKFMKAEAIKKFKTAPYEFMYLDRNYDIESGDLSQDSIVLGDLAGSSTRVFLHPNIRMFEANSEKVVIVTAEDQTDNIFILDLKTNDQLLVDMPYNGRVQKLSLSKQGSIGAFTLQPDYDIVGAERFNELANRTYSLNTETAETNELLDQFGKPIKSFDARVGLTGQYILIQDKNGIYQAVSPHNDYSATPIGSFTSFVDFIEAGSKIVFREAGDFVIFDIASSEAERIEFNSNELIQDIRLFNDEILVINSDFYASSWSTKLFSIDNFNDAILQVNSNDSSVSKFNPSYDGELLSFSINNTTCEQDDIGTNSVCKDIITEIYDISNKEKILELNGFDLVWLP